MEVGNATVLVVDDSGLNYMMLADILKTEGYAYEIAANGLEALEKMRKRQMDLVLLDIIMPEMDGYQVLEEMKLDNKLQHIPVIMISSLDDIGGIVRCLEMGADDYLARPFEPALLRVRIESCLKRRQSERALEESKRQLKDIINFLPDATFVIDRQGKVVEWNRAIEKITGIEAADIIGKGDYEYAIPFYGERRPIMIDLVKLSPEELDANYSDVRRVGDTVKGFANVTALSEKELYLEGIATVLRDYHGNEIGAIETIRDMTDHKNTQNELEKAKEAAELANQAKTDFLNTVSHELRTPLTSILGFSDVIKGKLLKTIFPLITSDNKKVMKNVEQIRENLDIIIMEGKRLTTLINDVLDLAKMEAGKVTWDMQTLPVAELIDHATAVTASLFEKKSLKLIKNIDSGLPDITGDRDKLLQVMINLISNAVKFTDEGTVTCRAAKSGEEIIVSVSDSGIGISEEEQSKVFEKFKQVGNTLTDKPKGTGLGLPISKHIVEHHGGRMWLESESGKGSTFYFTIPVLTDTNVRQTFENIAQIGHLRDMVMTGARTILDSVYATVEKIYANIESEKKSILEGRKRELKNIISVAETYIRGIMHQVENGVKQEDKAKEEVLETLKTLKYGNNDYIYVCSIDSRLLSHPDPAIDGADFSNVKDIHGNFVITPLVELSHSKGEGYYTYWWRRLESDDPTEKLAFGRYIPEWKWVLATGVYIDDIQQEALKRIEDEIEKLRKMLGNLRIAKSGYFYIFDSKANVIIHPDKNIEGTNFELLLKPLTNESLYDQLIKASKMPAYQHVYKWDRPEDPGNYIYDKMAWVKYFKGFDWYIASSIYVDEIK